MSLNRIVIDTRKAKKPKKVLSFSPSLIPRKTLFSSPVSSTMTASKSSDQKITFIGTQNRLKNNFNSYRSGNLDQRINIDGNQKVQTGTGDVCSPPVIEDVKLPVWHRMTKITFESFLHQVDWILEKLEIQDYTSDSDSTPRYQDICQKLRVEILLALNKLNLLSMPNTVYSKDERELMHNLSNLKGQLSDLRGQYHNLIKNFGPKVN